MAGQTALNGITQAGWHEPGQRGIGEIPASPARRADAGLPASRATPKDICCPCASVTTPRKTQLKPGQSRAGWIRKSPGMGGGAGRSYHSGMSRSPAPEPADTDSQPDRDAPDARRPEPDRPWGLSGVDPGWLADAFGFIVDVVTSGWR